MANFSECERIFDARHLRQGDILRPLEEKKDPWNGIVIVVTADCDIAKSKHAGRLTCVPVIPASTYLAMFYMPRRLAKIRDSLGDHLVNLLRKAQLSHLPEFSHPISADRTLKWVLQSEPSKISQSLHLSRDEAEKFISVAQIYRNSTYALDAPLRQQCDAYRLVAEAMGRSAQNLLKELTSHLRDLPGDAMYLNSIGDGQDEGYVAYLRLLRELKDNQVALKASHTSFEISHERIGRLKPPYLYRLTQQLGAVFSSIGLPKEYEDARDTCTDELLQKLGD